MTSYIIFTLYLNIGKRKDTMIATTFSKIPVVINLLSKDHYVTFLETQIAVSINNNTIK